MNPQVWGKRRHALSPHEGVRLVTPANGVFSGLGASISDPLEEEDRSKPSGPYCILSTASAPISNAPQLYFAGRISAGSSCLTLPSFLPPTVSCYF